VFGPVVDGAIAASVSALHGTEDPGALVALKWWIGDGLGVLVVAAPCWRGPNAGGIGSIRRPRSRKLLS
jgi:hypothetical protein